MSQVADSEQETLDALRLNMVPGIGPRTQQALIENFGSPGDILRADREQLMQTPGIGPKLASAIVAASRDSTAALAELNRCRDAGIDLLLHNGERYPRMLSQICDAPKVLYVRGTIEPRDELAIAIVGSRRCTMYGRQQAEQLAKALARADSRL